jgi:hypothetical protein
MSNQAGKGDTPRPVNGEKFRSNWDNIFKKHESNPINPHANDPGSRKPSIKTANKHRGSEFKAEEFGVD